MADKDQETPEESGPRFRPVAQLGALGQDLREIAHGSMKMQGLFSRAESLDSGRCGPSQQKCRCIPRARAISGFQKRRDLKTALILTTLTHKATSQKKNI